MSSKALSFMKRDIVIGEILDCVPSSSALKWSNLMTQFFFSLRRRYSHEL